VAPTTVLVFESVRVSIAEDERLAVHVIVLSKVIVVSPAFAHAVLPFVVYGSMPFQT
jgi:hypothetical protein